MSNTTQPRGVLLVGSVNLPTTKDVFSQIPTLLPNRLQRLPDGETVERDYFVSWQIQRFIDVPEILAYDIPTLKSRGELVFSTSTLTPERRAAALSKFKDLQTGYDDVAIESYAEFKKQKEAGLIPKHIRFQVSLPGISNVAAFFALDIVSDLEPLYEAALVRALQKIQSSIPHSELAIQIDASVEFAFLESCPPFRTYYTPVFPGVIDRLSRFANNVAPDVELGFHLCYGDIQHSHFIQPKDSGIMVEVTNALHKHVARPIQWVHIPVPKDRTDAEYFEPLSKLEWQIPELYLGVVHENDLEGTRERIAAAQKVVESFGVATECGLGRTLKEDFGSVMEILREVSGQIV